MTDLIIYGFTGYFALLSNIQVGVFILVVSELIGVYEELV
jgi:hypothetical protein